GMSAEAAGASIAAAVSATTTAIEEAFTASTLAEILGVTTLTLGAVTMVKAFQAVPVDDLERDASKLAAIIAMKVLIDEHGTSDGKTTESTGPKDEQQVRDTVLSRTGKGRNKPNREVESEQDLTDLYKDLTGNGKPSSLPNYKGEVKELPDGTKIGMRDESKSGGRTIDIYYPGKAKPVKVHLP
ncbi:MAG: hypothetical protein J2P18_16750, partial [Nocardia sp.]|nr:hypothetical protein [Nocardia sp.]